MPSLPLIRHKLRRFSRCWSIPRGALCLDVGSGDAPWPRADVLLESRPDDGAREGSMTVDRPLVIGSLEALPFRTQAFDYAYASHVLEHVGRPGTAVAELERVAPRGFLEVPLRLHELLSPRDDHRWAIRVEGGTLSFEPPPATDPELVAWVADRLEHDSSFRRFYWSRYAKDLAFGLEWEGRIKCKVSGDVSALRDRPTIDLDELARSLRAARQRGRALRPRVKRWLGRGARSRHPLSELLLACPDCRSHLEAGTESLRCAACPRDYPIVEGVPVLLPLPAGPSC